MSSETPPVYSVSSPEIPLDLTLRRSETDEDDLNNTSYSKNVGRQMSFPTSLDYHTNGPYGQYPSSTIYSADSNPPCSVSTTPSPPAVNPGQTLALPTGTCRSTSTSPTPYAENGYSDGKYGDSNSYEMFVLPKKRKNLWRPYDSRAAIGGEADRDSDSSDSVASTSDQDLKTPPMDPVKKRKMNMIQYKLNETSKSPTENNQCFVEETETSVDNESSQENGSNHSSPGKYNEPWNMSHTTESMPSYFTNMAEELTKSQLSLLSSYPEAREKMLSGMKKRDIFGWGLKLTKPSPESQANQQPSGVEQNSSQVNVSQSVCQDGEKTYIELQTVKSSSSPKSIESGSTEERTAEHSPFKVPKQDAPKSNISPKTVQSKAKLTDRAKPCENEKENVDVNASSKVFVQTRENVVKSFDETKNVPVKTKKGISLIDLVEEIEATAKKMEEDDETRNKRNRRVTALLDQCNHVKLQALDFLMANVLLQDREPQYKQKNEKVQKMLKGDKISSINMLDVVELQVEIGLN